MISAHHSSEGEPIPITPETLPIMLGNMDRDFPFSWRCPKKGHPLYLQEAPLDVQISEEEEDHLLVPAYLDNVCKTLHLPSSAVNLIEQAEQNVNGFTSPQSERISIVMGM